MQHSVTGLKFSTTIDLQIFKTFFVQSSKNMSKISILDLNKRGFFSNFALYSKGRNFSIAIFDILIFCNILHLEMNFEN